MTGTPAGGRARPATREPRGGLAMQRTRVALTVVLAAVLALAGAVAVLDAQDAEVKLGAFMPISGISADVGAQIKAGTEIAVERAQEQGLKLAGKPMRVRVMWYDDEGKADVGLNVVTRALTVDKITVGVGVLSSDVFLRVMDEFQKASVPVITCCSASLKIGERIAANKMGYVFQLSPTANDIVRSLVAAVHETLKPKKAALLNENTDAGPTSPRPRASGSSRTPRRWRWWPTSSWTVASPISPRSSPRSSAWEPRSSSARSTARVGPFSSTSGTS